MRIIFRSTAALCERVRADLRRPHEFAAERVGFLSCRFGKLKPSGFVVVAAEYHAVSDDDYIDDPRFGALVGERAFRAAVEHAYRNTVGMFHVHMHGHPGSPSFSSVDRHEQLAFVPSFFNACPNVPHGAILLSHDAAAGTCWLKAGKSSHPFTEVMIVGSSVTFWMGGRDDA